MSRTASSSDPRALDRRVFDQDRRDDGFSREARTDRAAPERRQEELILEAHWAASIDAATD